MTNSVREYRTKLEISQVEMASLCGVSRQTIHAIERGTFNPSVVLALKIARVLKKRVEDLFELEKGD
jgi:putative transcriptional regulator